MTTYETLKALEAENGSLRDSLKDMLALFGKTHRDEWLNDSAYNTALIVIAKAKQALNRKEPS